MNPWVDFFSTVAIRLVCGFALGAFAAFVFGFRVFMRAIAESTLPWERILVWGAVGAIACLFTTPRDSLPWMKP